MKRVEITLFYDYEVRGEKCFGMSTGKVEGYSIAEGTIAGLLVIAQGTGSTAYAENSKYYIIKALFLMVIVYLRHTNK